MLSRSKRTLAVLSVSVISVFAAGAAVVTAVATGAGEDKWQKGANSPWSATSSKTTFVSSILTITCTSNTAGGSSVGPGPDAGALAMKAPTFKTCKDSAGGTDTVTSAASGWKVNFVSDTGNSACPAGTGKDETSGSDCVVLTVPKAGATIKVGAIAGCVITVQPNGAGAVGAKVKDPGGTTKDTFTLTNQSVAFSGNSSCPISGTAKFSGTYTLKSPNGGVLVDTS